MPHWLIKAGVQGAISFLPRPHFWNGLFQRYLSRSLDLSAQKLEVKLRECDRHLRGLISTRTTNDEGFDALELGTGWFPIIPLGLYLCGARAVWTVDIQPFLYREQLNQLLGHFQDFAQQGRLKQLLPLARPERIERLLGARAQALNLAPEKWLEQLNIHVLVRDAQQVPLAPNSVDLFFSSGVIEYIPRPVLANIFQEFKRIAKPRAVMTHRINLVDQFSYFDHRISPLNYLRFTDRQWRWFNNRLVWHSRLRMPEYRRLLIEAGFEIISEEDQRASEEQLDRVPLAPEFKKYSREDLLVLESFIAARLADKPATHNVSA